jgi:hypothetical protein
MIKRRQLEHSGIRLWQDSSRKVGDWTNATSLETVPDKRINLPAGRLQFVSYRRLTSQGGTLGDWVISIARVVFTDNDQNPYCKAFWMALSDSEHVAGMIGENALTIMQTLYPNARPSQMPVYYTNNYYGSMVVVVRLVFDNDTENLVKFMAGALSNEWGLGDIISNYEPVDSRRDISNSTERAEQSGTIISSGSYTSDRVKALLGHIDHIGGDSSVYADVSRVKRAGTRARDDSYSKCRNLDWGVWYTDYDVTCTPLH